MGKAMPILIVQEGVCESPCGELGLQFDEELEHALAVGDLSGAKPHRE